MMRVLLDANVVLDVLLERRPFVDDAKRLWQASDDGLFDGCIASFTLPTIHYICRKHADLHAANRAVDMGLEPSRRLRCSECVLAARHMPGGDFEDNLQIACADFMQGIVTRDASHFARSPIQVYSPAEFLTVLKPG